MQLKQIPEGYNTSVPMWHMEEPSTDDITYPEAELAQRIRRLKAVDRPKHMTIPEHKGHMADLLGFSFVPQDANLMAWEKYENPYYIYYMGWNSTLAGGAHVAPQFLGYDTAYWNVGVKAIIRDMMKHKKTLVENYSRQDASDVVLSATALDSRSRQARRDQRLDELLEVDEAVRKQVGKYYWQWPGQEQGLYLKTFGPNKTAVHTSPVTTLINFISGKPGVNGRAHFYELAGKRIYRFVPWDARLNVPDHEILIDVATDLSPLFNGEPVYDRSTHRWCDWPQWLTKILVPKYLVRGANGLRDGNRLANYINRVKQGKMTGTGGYFAITREDYMSFIGLDRFDDRMHATRSEVTHTYVQTHFDGKGQLTFPDWQQDNFVPVVEEYAVAPDPEETINMDGVSLAELEAMFDEQGEI